MLLLSPGYFHLKTFLSCTVLQPNTICKGQGARIKPLRDYSLIILSPIEDIFVVRTTIILYSKCKVVLVPPYHLLFCSLPSLRSTLYSRAQEIQISLRDTKHKVPTSMTKQKKSQKLFESQLFEWVWQQSILIGLLSLWLFLASECNVASNCILPSIEQQSIHM